MAEFEKQAENVHLSLDQLRRDLQENKFECLLVEHNPTCIESADRFRPEARDQSPVSLPSRNAPEPSRSILRPSAFTAGHNRVVGCAIYFGTYSTWDGCCTYLEDLYVTPAARGRGAGSALLAAVARLANARGSARLQWQALSWNERAIRFYKSPRIGARERIDDDGTTWLNFIMERDAISRLASL